MSKTKEKNQKSGQADRDSDGISSKLKVPAAAAGVAAAAVGGAVAIKNVHKNRTSKTAKLKEGLSEAGDKARDLSKHLPGR